MPRLVSRIELARIAGVSPAAITKACRKQLAPACRGTRVDVDHAAVREYLEAKGKKPPPRIDTDAAPTPSVKTSSSGADRPTPSKEQESAAPGAPTEPRPAPRSKIVSREVEADVGAIADMTVREVVRNFGSVTAFKDWLQALKSIESVREKNLRNAQTEGKLISRELVKVHVMGAIDACNQRLLRDASKTIASRVFEAKSAGRSREEAERMVRETISKHLVPVKVTAVRVLRSNAERKAPEARNMPAPNKPKRSSGA